MLLFSSCLVNSIVDIVPAIDTVQVIMQAVPQPAEAALLLSTQTRLA